MLTPLASAPLAALAAGDSAAAPAASGPPPALVATGYRLTLTGAADGVADALLPAKTLYARLRSGSASYLSAALPYTSALAEAVTARPGGDLRLEQVARYADGSEAAETLLTVALESVQIARGTRSSSITLTGHRQSTNGSPASHRLAGSSIADGTTAHTATAPGIDPALRPGDTVEVAGVSFVIGLLELQISSGSATTKMAE